MVTVVLSLVFNFVAASIATYLVNKYTSKIGWLIVAINILTYLWALVLVIGLASYKVPLINGLFVGWWTVGIPAFGLFLAFCAWLSQSPFLPNLQAIIEGARGRAEEEQWSGAGTDVEIETPPVRPHVPQAGVVTELSHGHFTAASICDKGRRDHNEDRVVMLPERGLFAAIDGIGGHACGEVAADILRQKLVQYCVGAPETPKLIKAFEEAEKEMIADAKRRGVEDMGCVATVAWLKQLNDGRVEARIAHIGDTRAFVGGADKLVVQITKDMSYIPEELPEQEQMRHPMRRFVSGSLGILRDEDGGKKMTERANFIKRPFPAGSTFLLVTDGVSDGIDRGEIGGIFNQAFGKEPRVMASMLFLASMDGQPRYNKEDNIGIVVIQTK